MSTNYYLGCHECERESGRAIRNPARDYFERLEKSRKAIELFVESDLQSWGQITLDCDEVDMAFVSEHRGHALYFRSEYVQQPKLIKGEAECQSTTVKK